MDFFEKLGSLSFGSWMLILMLTTLLSMIGFVYFKSRSEIIRERIEGLDILSKGTEEQKVLRLPIHKRLGLMAETRTQIYLNKYMKDGQLRPLKLKLIQANDHVTEPIQHWSKKFVLAGSGLLVGLILGAAAENPNLTVIALFTVAGFLYPDYKLSKKLKKRQMQIKKELPDFLDLLAATAPSAKNLEDAIKKVCDRSEGEVVTEFKRTLEEINAGRKKKDALRDFAKRCAIQEIDSFVAQINQTDVFGTSIEKTLLMQAEKIRKLKKQMAEIKAKQAGVMLLLPSMFLLFTIMIMIAGPNIVQFIDSMSQLK